MVNLSSISKVPEKIWSGIQSAMDQPAVKVALIIIGLFAVVLIMFYALHLGFVPPLYLHPFFII